jgi:hypothetical protein
MFRSLRLRENCLNTQMNEACATSFEIRTKPLIVIEAVTCASPLTYCRRKLMEVIKGVAYASPLQTLTKAVTSIMGVLLVPFLQT